MNRDANQFSLFSTLLAPMILSLICACAPPEALEKQALAEECTFSSSRDFEVEGYGAYTVGGWQGSPQQVCVTSLEEHGPGSIREAINTGHEPTVVSFAVDGEIFLENPIVLPSNISIDGRGHDIRFIGKGFVIRGAEEVILTNFAIEDVYDVSHDGIAIGGPDLTSHNVVMDHLRFSFTNGMGSAEFVDEAISVVFGSYNVTIQWSRFDHWEKVALLGNGDADSELDKNLSVTMHHNFFNQTGRRHPRGRWGRFDAYNNYFYDWHMFEFAGPPVWHLSHGAKCDERCRMRLASNIFERYWHETDIISDSNKASVCEKLGEIRHEGNFIHPDNEEELVFGVHCLPSRWEPEYSAEIETANVELAERLKVETGNVL